MHNKFGGGSPTYPKQNIQKVAPVPRTNIHRAETQMQMPKILKNAEEYSAQKLAGGRRASPEVK